MFMAQRDLHSYVDLDSTFQFGHSALASAHLAQMMSEHYRVDQSPMGKGLDEPQRGHAKVQNDDSGDSSPHFEFQNFGNPVGKIESGSRIDLYDQSQDQTLLNAKELDSYEFVPMSSSTGEHPVPRTIAESRHIRSSRPVARSRSPQNRANTNSRVTKPAKAKKPAKSSTKTPYLERPLSELTKDMDIPIRDMEEWVNRPLGVRLKEVEKRNGYITRPMNSFMLYRSAYAERTKQYCIQNNHQIVSAVSGQSWPKEPTEIREYYNRLAQVERDNHTRAHPNYKFSPSKGTTTSYHRRRKDVTSEEESHDGSSEADADVDHGWEPRSDGRKLDPCINDLDGLIVPRNVQTLNSKNRSLNHGFIDQAWHLQNQWDATQSNLNLSQKEQTSWHTSNDIDARQAQQQQYWRDFIPNPHYFDPSSNQDLFQQPSSVLGLPSADLFGGIQQSLTEIASDDFQIDPMLLHFEHQQTPPLDEPATPNAFEEISPLAGPEVLSAIDNGNAPKQSGFAFPVDRSGFSENHLHDSHYQSPKNRFGDFDIWMEIAPPSRAPSP